MGSALACSGSTLELAGKAYAPHRAALDLFTEANPAAPLLQKPCPIDPIQKETYIVEKSNQQTKQKTNDFDT